MFPSGRTLRLLPMRKRVLHAYAGKKAKVCRFVVFVLLNVFSSKAGLRKGGCNWLKCGRNRESARIEGQRQLSGVFFVQRSFFPIDELASLDLGRRWTKVSGVGISAIPVYTS